MRVEIPFNENFFRDQMFSLFNFVWHKNLEKNKYNLYYALGMLICGGLLVYLGAMVGYILIATGFHYLIVFFNYYYNYKSTKAKFKATVRQEINSTKNSKIINVWEFNNDYLYYKDHKQETKMNWTAFKDYRIYEDNLFLNVINGLTFILSRNEMSSAEFKLVINFLKDKVKEVT